MKKITFFPLIGFLTSMIMVLFLILTLPEHALAETLQAVKATPDQEKRSTIQAVDGYAVLSEDLTIAQTREAALANAKRQAVENTRTYRASHK